MSVTAAIAVVILAVALAMTYWTPLRRVKTAVGAAHLVETGHAFLLLGLAVGLFALGAEAHLWGALKPIIGFVAGWVGFSAGMRFDRRVLTPIPAQAWVTALAPGIAAGLAVAGTSAAILLGVGVPVREGISAALILGAAAASSGPTLVITLRGRRAGRDSKLRPSLRMMAFSAGVDDLVTIVLTVAAFTAMQPGSAVMTPVVFAAASVVGGVLLGVMMWLFLGGRSNDEEHLLLGLGMLAFVAGAAGWLQMSPACLMAIAAITLVNLPGERAIRLFEAVRRVERPAVVMLMTIVGFDAAGVASLVFFPLFGLMTLFRLGAKWGAGELAAVPIRTGPNLAACRGWSLGLVPQGTLGLIVVVTFYDTWPDPVVRAVLAAVAAASLVNEVIAPWLLWRGVRAIRRDAGSPGPPAPEEVAR